MSAKAPKVHPPPICPYCQAEAVWLADSSSIYRGTDYGPAWICRPCDAWVGVHKGTTNALGRLADAELRKAKIAMHAVFDPLWRERMIRSGLSQGHARGKAYKWLAGELGIERKDCHVGMFDLETCRRATELCRPHLQRMVQASIQRRGSAR